MFWRPRLQRTAADSNDHYLGLHSRWTCRRATFLISLFLLPEFPPPF
jgi:hypothetical protein